jgi:hypothetical protein
MPGEGSFTVVVDRATATAAPAVLFGLVGAAIASAHNSSRDNDKANALAPYVGEISNRSILQESFGKTFKDGGSFTEISFFDRELKDDERRQFDAILALTFKDWGLRLRNQNDERLAGFFELQAKMWRTRDDQILWDEYESILGQGRRHFSEYQQDKNLFVSEMKETVASAGYRLAAKIVYPRGRVN